MLRCCNFNVTLLSVPYCSKVAVGKAHADLFSIASRVELSISGSQGFDKEAVFKA